MARSGDPCWRSEFTERDPSNFLFPALNLNTDEISCAIGCASLARLEQTIASRFAFFKNFERQLADVSTVCSAYPFLPTDSPFFCPVIVNKDGISCSKIEFADAVRAEGIGVKTHYRLLVADWPYLKPYLADDFDTPNARTMRDRSFNLYLNENYGEREARDAAQAIAKVEQRFGKASA